MFSYVKLNFLLAANCIFLNGENVTVKFLSQFCKEKNVMLTMNTCWSNDNLKNLLGNLKKHENAKLTAIYNNFTDLGGYFSYLSSNNYFMVDLRKCKSSWIILDKANQSDLFRYPLKWLLIASEPETIILNKILETYNIFPASHVIIANSKKDDFELRQPYRADKTRNIIWEDYGYWSERKGLKEFLLHQHPSNRRKNLQSINMNLSLVLKNEDTWKHLEDFKYPNVDTFIKQSWVSTKHLLEYCNISHQFIKTDDFGYLNKTSGKWSGIVGDLLYGRAQMSASPPLLNSARVQVIDFLVMAYPTQIRFVLRKPPLSYVSNIFILPFYWTVWVAMVLVLCLFGVALYIILNWETKYKRKINFQERFRINDVLLITFETLCQQGTMTESRSIAGRTISLIFLTSFMFLYVAYSANIVALLQSTTEITALEQLFSSRMEVGAQNVYYMKNYLTGAKDKVRQDLYNKKIGPRGFYSLEEGCERVRQGFFALHMELGAGYHQILKTFTDYEVCSLQELEGFAKSPGGYMCVPRNSPYKEIIKVGYLRIDEYGIRKRNCYRVFKKPKCYSQGASFDSVGIVDAYPAILLWIYGIVLALLIFFIEKALQRIKFKMQNTLLIEHN